MKFWVVYDRDRWGFSLNVVRAESADEAKMLVSPHGRPDYMDVEELQDGTEPSILWCHDHSPDTPRED